MLFKPVSRSLADATSVINLESTTLIRQQAFLFKVLAVNNKEKATNSPPTGINPSGILSKN